MLSAMSGNWDRTDPYIQVLRAAWVLTRLDSEFTSGSSFNLQLSECGTHSTTFRETGVTVIQSLGLDRQDVTRQQLLNRIADEVGGDTGFAAAVDHLATCVRAFHQTMTSTEPAVDACLDAIAEARRDYELKYESCVSAIDTDSGFGRKG
ncbi:hypothetical protein ACFVUS_04650 [Nocardia sp. NPDC058058]|uniref:hypothetical protein n=1 Tax=Nocardia sp. NPDC058058 TaxID=3346317 RepID=UPI0036DF85FC